MSTVALVVWRVDERLEEVIGQRIRLVDQRLTQRRCLCGHGIPEGVGAGLGNVVEHLPGQSWPPAVPHQRLM